MAIYTGLIATLLAAGCAGPQAESSKPKVAVLDFRGAKSGELDDAVRAMLGDDYRIVGTDEYLHAARRLHAKTMKRSHVKKVARKLGVDAVVYGKVVRRSRSKYALSLRVRDGKSGKLLSKMRIPVRKRREMSKKNARKLEHKLLALMEDVAPAPNADDDEDAAVARAEPKRKSRRARRSHRDEEDSATVAKAETKRKSRHARRSHRDEEDDVAVAARAEPKRKSRRAKRSDDVELEDDFVIVDKMRDGQVIDDEVPPGLQ